MSAQNEHPGDVAADTRTLIIATASDLAADFLFYDRKEDDDLPPGVIERAIKDGSVTIDEIVATFAQGLQQNLESPEPLGGKS